MPNSKSETSLLQKYIPILDWLPKYTGDKAKKDLTAGLTVGAMLVPQGMAYAMIAGLPAIYGLYASIVPLIIYAIFGTSRQLAVGPVAMVSLLTAAGVGSIATEGTGQYIQLAIMAAVMVGLFQFLMGVFRLGFIVQFLSHPVISGFTSAAALIIGLSQLKHLLGVDLERSKNIFVILWGAISKIQNVEPLTLLIGVGSILLILALRKWNKSFPSALAVVVLSTLAVWGFGLQNMGVSIVRDVPQGLPSFQTPQFSWEDVKALFPTVLAISLVGFMESIAVAKAVANRHPEYKVDSNQELIGLGLANIVGGMFQSYPTTGGFSRTAVNEQAGAQTGIASIITAIVIGLTVLFLTPLFYYLPQAVLAAIIMVAVFGLIDIKEAKFLWNTRKKDFLMLLATFLGTLLLGIEEGIGIGVIISIVIVIYRSSRPHMAVLGWIPEKDIYRNIERYPEAKTTTQTLMVRIDAALYFANVDYIKERLQELENSEVQQLKNIIIDANGINDVDSSAIHALKELIKEYEEQGVDWYFAAVKGPVRDMFEKTGIYEHLGDSHFFDTVNEANKRLLGHEILD